MQPPDVLSNDWWAEWYSSVFESLIPLPKWKKEARNVAVGDIVLVKYAKKLTPSLYKLARVVEAKTDRKGLVRTVVVEMRPTDSRERSLPYRSKKLTRMTLPVQRLVVLHAVEDLDKVTTPNLLGDIDSAKENVGEVVMQASSKDMP